MMPVLFRVPGIDLELPGYGLMLMISFLLSVVWGARRAAKSRANPDVVLNCAFIALLGGVTGCRLMYVVHYWDEQFAHLPNWAATAWAIIDIRQGGLEVYGGMITAMLGALVYLGMYRHSIRWYMDIMAPAAALGMGIGRIGCFLNGCCWGHVCDLPWALRFPYGSNPAIAQWYDGEPGLDLPKELIYFPPGGIGRQGRAAYLVSRDVLRVTEQDLQEIEATAAMLLQQQLDLQRRRDQTASPDEKAGLQVRIDRLNDRARRLKPSSGCCSRLLVGDVWTQMRNYNVTLDEIQRLARAHPSQPAHPAQLYSAAVLILMALLLNAVYWRRTRDGQVVCALLLVEPWSRYALEVLRADNPVDTLGAFTISQFLAATLSAVGLLGFVALRYLPPRSPRAKPWEPPEEEAGGGKKDQKKTRRRM